MIKFYWNPNALEHIMKNLVKVDINVKAGAKKALIESAKGVMSQSVLEVPLDTGALSTSGYIEDPKEIGNRISITVGYGGANDKRNPESGKMASEYAMVVHETPEYHHSEGKWKYLEDPIRAYQGAFLNTFAKEMKVVFSKGVTPR